MRVELIARTAFYGLNLSGDIPWEPGEDNQTSFHDETYDGQALAEFAGRACYQSWGRPNPDTATNKGYLANILRIGHLSVIEHASVTFYVTGVSRSLTHELIRHRHLSYSQLSQRYVDESETEFVTPPLILEAERLDETFAEMMADALSNYEGLVRYLTAKFPDKSRKEIRQAARAVLPNATETKIVVTGNYRAWWEVIQLRATEAADVEIRALAVAILRKLQYEAPYIFNHFKISKLEDGTEIATLTPIG